MNLTIRRYFRLRQVMPFLTPARAWRVAMSSEAFEPDMHAE